MAIIGSCGHGVEDLDDLKNVSVKAWEITEDGWTKAIHYKSVCKDCYKEYEQEDYLLKDTEEEYDWLNEGD